MEGKVPGGQNIRTGNMSGIIVGAGTAVTGNIKQVGNMTTTDRHGVTIQDIFNRQDAATGPAHDCSEEEAKALPKEWPSRDHEHDNVQVKLSTESSQDVEKFRDMAAGKLQHDHYTMKSNPRGRFLMFSNRKFNIDGKVSTLPVEADEDALQTLFEGLGFDCSKKLNRKREEMISDLEQEMQKAKPDYDCFVMAVASHGDIDVIISSDGQYVKIAELRKIVDKTKEYNGKPKLFFIEAGRGGQTNIREKGPEEGDAVDAGPNFADNFIALSMVPNYTIGGGLRSYFLQAVAYIFSRYAYTEEITVMARRVDRLVSWSGCQVPQYTTSLRKKLYFFPGLSE